MLVLLLLLLASYAVGIALGISGPVASEPLTASVGSAIPFLAFAVRLDPLASFFVLTISLAAFGRERSHESHSSPRRYFQIFIRTRSLSEHSKTCPFQENLKLSPRCNR
jgi:hypothetical protein